MIKRHQRIARFPKKQYRSFQFCTIQTEVLMNAAEQVLSLVELRVILSMRDCRARDGV